VKKKKSGHLDQNNTQLRRERELDVGEKKNGRAGGGKKKKSPIATSRIGKQGEGGVATPGG